LVIRPYASTRRVSGGLLVEQAGRADTEDLLGQLGRHEEVWAGGAQNFHEEAHFVKVHVAAPS
jgi:hypothetical protein